MGSIKWNSVSVDVSYSYNTGVMEYQGVNTKNKELIFNESFPVGTNNIGEFLAIVHALALLKTQGDLIKPIYTDSIIAMTWVYKKKVNTSLVRNKDTAKLHRIINRAEQWLESNSYRNSILKWNTKKWGEIPADFGRK